MHRRLEGIAVFVGLCLAVAAGGAVFADPGWPGFRGPNSDGSVPGAELFDGKATTLQLDWKRRLGSGYSGSPKSLENCWHEMQSPLESYEYREESQTCLAVKEFTL